jgi:ribosome-associated toxin RatA of RatAB toxin-antitoxin module
VRTAIGVTIGAPPEVVFALAHDVARWRDLLPHYRSARVERTEAGGSRVVRFVAVRPGLLRVPVLWRSRTWAEPEARRLRFIHLGGATRTMDVTWRIEPVEGGCRVTIEHVFRAPRAWAWFIDRAFTQPIARQTLASFKAIAEAVAAPSAAGASRASRTSRAS